MLINSHQFELKCSYGKVGWDDSIVEAFACKTQNLSITQTKQLITKLSDSHPETNRDKVNTILIFEQICEFFSTGLERHFKNLSGIAIQYSGLKKITKGDLKHLGNLKSLSLFGNKLECLENDLFRFNPQLELISLFKNNLKHIFPNVFQGLHHLKRVYMNSNPCKNRDYLTREAIEQLKSEAFETCQPTPAMIDYAELESEKFQIESANEKIRSSLEAVTHNFIEINKKLRRTQEGFELLKGEIATTPDDEAMEDGGNGTKV